MNEELLSKIEQAAQIRNISAGTLRTYTYGIKMFLDFLGDNTDPLDVDMEDVYDFIVCRQNERRNKASTINCSTSSLRFYFKYVLHKFWDDDTVPRMLEDHFMPQVLSSEEVELLLNSADNLKHKAIFTLMYSSGLRVSEARHLDYCDISRKDMQVYVKKSKTRSDRYTILSQRCLNILTEYWYRYGRPRGILFPSASTGTYLTNSGIEAAFYHAYERSGIKKKITCHSLRHSFATHLFEDGTDIKYIQALLGHRSLNSTEIYLHLGNATKIGIISPFDARAGKR